jgi:hypothetical protein
MGLLTRPDGVLRLVFVTGSHGNASDPLEDVFVLVLPQPHWLDPLPQPTYPTTSRLIVGPGAMPRMTRLKSGIVDPADRSHIIFPVDVLDQSFITVPGPAPKAIMTKTIDARLQNDDSMTFTIRDADQPSEVRTSARRMPGNPAALIP